jgi:hypothetical protein
MTKISALRPTTPLELVAWEHEVDLRTVSHKAAWLKKVAKKYKLKNGQAVLYSNKAWDRFRAVQLINGLPIVLLFPVEETYELRHALFEQIAAWLVSSYKMPKKLTKDLHDVFVEEEYNEAVA